MEMNITLKEYVEKVGVTELKKEIKNIFIENSEEIEAPLFMLDGMEVFG